MAISLGTRVKTDPNLLARARKDPGLRSKLPDKFLTPSQLQARQRNAYLADLGNVGSPLSGQSLVNAAQQTVNADYAPLLSDVGKQETIVNKSAGLQGDWAKRYYGDLNGLISSIGGAQTTANTNAVQGAINAGTTAHGAVTAADTEAQKRLAADAAVRGSDVQGDAVPNQAARTQTAQDQVTANAQAAQTGAQNFGDVQSAFLRGLQGATAQQGGEYQQQITGQQGQLLNQLGQTRKDLALKQAGAYTDTLLKLRQNEALNGITAAGLGIKQDAAAATADANAGAEGRKYGYTPTEWLKLPAQTRTGIVTAANKKAPAAKPTTGYGSGLPGMNKYGYTYDEWTGLSTGDKNRARNGKGKSGGGGGAGGDASNALVGTAQSDTTGALSDAKSLVAEGVKDRHKLASILLAGRPETAATVNQKTKDGSVSRKVVQRPALAKHDALWTSVALDVLLDGHVSRYNANRLHAQGLKVQDLGFPSYTDSLQTSKAKNSPSQRAPGGT